MTASTTLEALRSEGLRAGILPVGRLPDIEKDIADLLSEGVLDKGLYELYLSGMRYAVPASLPNARSIIVVAVPQPKTVLHFTWKGEDAPVVVPPTYSHNKDINEMVRNILIGAPGNSAGRFERAFLPLKTVAARTGLVRYGRNNITYLEGHGSFHRLTAFFTDIDLKEDDWQEKGMLPACKTCRLCMKNCPMSIIGEGRFVVHAERCLTYLNEMPSEKAFPSDVGPKAHNAIIGCMVCQNVCPYNSKVKDWAEDGASFSQAETECLLNGRLEGRTAEELAKKLEPYGLDLTSFPRNLEVILMGI